jgi:hypothetical protein
MQHNRTCPSKRTGHIRAIEQPAGAPEPASTTNERGSNSRKCGSPNFRSRSLTSRQVLESWRGCGGSIESISVERHSFREEQPLELRLLIQRGSAFKRSDALGRTCSANARMPSTIEFVDRLGGDPVDTSSETVTQSSRVLGSGRRLPGSCRRAPVRSCTPRAAGCAVRARPARRVRGRHCGWIHRLACCRHTLGAPRTWGRVSRAHRATRQIDLGSRCSRPSHCILRTWAGANRAPMGRDG